MSLTREGRGAIHLRAGRDSLKYSAPPLGTRTAPNATGRSDDRACSSHFAESFVILDSRQCRIGERFERARTTRLNGRQV